MVGTLRACHKAVEATAKRVCLNWRWPTLHQNVKIGKSIVVAASSP